MRLVALLRGINVGGRSMIKMAELRSAFESLGFKDVLTYIQSGNVVFTSDARRAGLASKIEKGLESKFGFRGRVFVYSANELEKAAANNPFEPERRDKEQYSQLMFLERKPTAERWDALLAMAGDEYRFAIRGKVVYFAYARSFAGRRRSLDIEKVLAVAGTARTWKVVDKLIGLARSDSAG